MTEEMKQSEGEKKALKTGLVIFGFIAAFWLGDWTGATEAGTKHVEAPAPAEASTKTHRLFYSSPLPNDVDGYYMKSYDEGVFVIEHGNRVLTAVCHASVDEWPNCNRTVGTVGTTLSQKAEEIWRMPGNEGYLMMTVTTATLHGAEPNTYYYEEDVLEITSNKLK